jgi:hypothetical protein
MSGDIRVLQRSQGVNAGDSHIPVGIPTPELRSTTTLRIETAIIRQPFNQGQNIQRSQTRLRDKNVPEVHVVILQQVSGKMFAVFVN